MNLKRKIQDGGFNGLQNNHLGESSGRLENGKF